MSREYLNVIAEIRLAVNAGRKEADRLVEVTQLTEASEREAREAGDDYLASKFHGLAAELEYLSQLTVRRQEQHLCDRYDIITAECAMIENYLASK